ncbi:cytochrome c biogenesis protein ResB [Streptomyces sodiiphilus]|uniref:Cytochrome c biogenesis protein ResB n=1 Tax=Streptomyces sodiiphilus TaxID=226217 RepID=A0ABN2PTX7_9ACTN
MTDDVRNRQPEGRGPDADGPDADAPAGAGLSTAPSPEEADAGKAVPGSFGGVRAPGARGAAAWTAREAIGWGRWFWRQLTSMRIALILLFLLALASVPGSLIPQNGVDATLVADFRARNETLAQVYDRLQLFDVYSSVWFSAIYLLLFVSLIGCIVPRTWQFALQLRGRPPRAPRRLSRMPAHTAWRTRTPPAEVLDSAERLLRSRRFRRARDEDSVAAEKGYLREAGNLVFHVALIVMLVAFAAGQLYRSEGGKLVVEGDGFTNTLTQYDDFNSGVLFDVNELEPFGFTLEEFHAAFVREPGPDFGSPSEFRADITYWRAGEDTETATSIEVNHPLTVGEAKVYLIGHGFAPVVTVTDGQGETAFTGPVPFLPQDEALHSTGVIKVTDYRDENGEPGQLGFQGFFNPTYGINAERGPHSTFPDPDFPVLTLNAFHGDLGLDSGLPQNVYQLDTTNMEQFEDGEGDLFRQDLLPGESFDLPDGKGTLTFHGYERWASFQISTRAGTGWALAGSMAAVVGLAASLLLQRRRVWVRATEGPDGRTIVEMGSLGRTESPRIPEELADLAARLHAIAPALPGPHPAPGTAGDPAGAPASDQADGSADAPASDPADDPAEGARR